jgi:hypothetical protein
MTSAERAIVFEATDTTLLDVVQHKLEAEGLEPRRLGRTHAALMGGGNAAFMQMIDVPVRHRELALLLLEAEQSGEVDDLDAQALAATADATPHHSARQNAPGAQLQAALASDASPPAFGSHILRSLVGAAVGGFLGMTLATVCGLIARGLGASFEPATTGYAMLLGAALGVLPISWRHPLWATGAFLLALAFLHAAP